MDKKANVVEKEAVVIRFSGDSGDGMQLTGNLFTDESALFGNDVATFPDYPAEIRAPQGTVGGVSGFQVHFGKRKIHTPGDYADVLVAMNPAALMANRRWIKKGGTVITDVDTFTEKNFLKAGFKTDDPITELKLEDYNVILAPVSTLTKEALKDSGLDNKSILRSKNMFALGICYNLFDKSFENTFNYFERKFGKKPQIVEANKKVLQAGYDYASNVHALPSYRVEPAKIEKGKYRSISGNQATAWGLLAAAEKANLPLFCGSYPITPATEILQYIAERQDLGAKTFQAEDEIAGICTAIGASFAGNFAVTTTSGPGLALKTEAAGLAVITELPLVIVDVQRGGPSTGLPTKTEQADLLQALYSRNGESPLPVIAASSPADCFEYAFQAGRIALEHMTPVILLTDGFIANGTAPMRIKPMSEYPTITPRFAKEGNSNYQPYGRPSDGSMTREWAIPGTKGLEHRIGGLEKMAVTGTVSYVPENHQVMTDERQAKVDQVVVKVPDQEVIGDASGDLLVVGWGSTYGHLHDAVDELRTEGHKVSFANFNYINPLPKNTADVLGRFKKIVVAELNSGQFANYLRINFQQFEYNQYNKVQGLPFTVEELKEAFKKYL
ncbi:MAG: 2-oxoacid:acceptor oxidoreductase subunit alpha [Bacteroidales bacterium]|nr:2-oxoacid:acceptor oxidoreductase subunit alpha [Bacteroidales bacterium]